MGFFQQFFGSFYSAPLYRSLRTQPGNGLGYSCLLVLFTTFLAFLLYLPDMNRVHTALFVGENGRISAFDDVLRQAAAQTPTMTFQNYKLHTQEPGKHVIHLSVDIMGEHAEGDAITIDTSGATTYSNMQTPILITENEIITQSEKETKVKSFRELDNSNAHPEKAYTIGRAEAQQAAQDFSKFMHENLTMFYLVIGSFCLLFIIAFLYVARIITVLLIALAGLLIANIMRTQLNFDMAMRFAAVSFTPVAMLDLIIPKLTGGTVSGFILLICGIIMFAVAFRASRMPE